MKMGYHRKHNMCWLLLILIINQTRSATVSNTTVSNSSVSYSSTTSKSTDTTNISSGSIPSVSSTEKTTATITTRPPVIGENCTDITSCNWTNSGCQNNTCQCNNDSFEVNNTTCFKVPSVEMTVFDDNETSVIICWKPFLEVQHLITDGTIQLRVSAQELDLNTLKNCTLNQSLNFATCTDLLPGAQYNISVNLNHTMGYFHVQKSEIFIKKPAQPGPINQNGTNFTAPNVTLSWKASVGLVDNYSVIVQDSDGGIVVNETSDNNESHILITGLGHGRNYTVKLKANRLNKTSDPREDSFTTTIIPPELPGSVTVQETSITNSSLNLTWTEPSDFNGPRVGYIVCMVERIYPNATATNKGCNETSKKWFLVTNLTAGAFYQFFVYSLNSKYNSSKPKVSEEKQTHEGRPGVVDDVTLISFEDKIEVMWHRPKQPFGNIIAYKINVSNMENISDCHMWLLITDKFSINETKESSGCTSQNQNIRVNEEYMAVNITSLMPYSNYSIVVMAYTKVGAGIQYSNTTTTIETVPGNVTDVVGIATNATEILVSWHAPLIRTGRTYYHIKVYDSIANELNQSINVTGYEVQNYTFTGLQEYWVYQFAVYASTSKGSSSPVYSTNVTTLEASPGATVGTTVVVHKNNSYCDATKVSLYWIEPNLVDRNGKIVQYNISLMSGNNVTIYTRPIDKPDPYSEISQDWSRTLDTKPEQNYTVQVWAITETGKQGEKGEKTSFKSVACKPPAYSVGTDLIAAPVMSTSSFTVKLDLNFFRNDGQGKIVSYGLVVSDTKSNKDEYDKLPDLGQGNCPCKLNLSTLQKEVENNEKFSQYTVENLPEDTSFYLKMYACTNGGCSASQYYGPFKTNKSPVSESSSSATVIAVVVVLVLFAIVAAFGGVILYRKGYHTRILATLRKHSSDQQDSVAFNHVSGDTEHISRKRPFKFSMLDEYLEEMNKDSKLGFAREYEDIQKLSPRHSTEAALLGENKSKNRWVNILAFDHSRVKLQLLDEDDPTSDYINANFIPDLKRQRVYIATQGPLPGTIDDFWRMVWEQKVSVIVMLTKCKEGNRVKCEMYWPNELHDAKQYGDIVVRPISISNLDKFDINVFDVSMNEETRRVMHFHFQEFPDFSADVDFLTFVNFVKTVRQHSPHKMQGPIVVHCSAGVGRTGTYITVDCLQQLVESPDFDFNAEVDIFDYVLTMRDHRTLMVQVEQQYIMIHECLRILLEQRKQAEADEGVEETLYENQAFDPDPDEETDKLYENASNIPRTEL